MKIRAHIKGNESTDLYAREQIKQMKHILDKFVTEDGFNEYCDHNSIRIGVGAEEDVDLYFAPRTWEAAEQFLMFCICHLIETYELDKFPYYSELLDRYASALGIERGEFE